VTEIIFISALYQAPSEVFYDVIAALPDTLGTVALFAHNPGISYFVNSLNTKIKINHMPTCAIFAISADTAEWAGFAKAKKEALFYDYPKNAV
jgi:phosphohistidine phosphatase